MDTLTAFRTLTNSEKLRFIRSNFGEPLSSDESLDIVSVNLLRGILPNGEIIENVTLTPEVATLTELLTTVEYLPIEILLEITKNLDYNSVLKLCNANKKFSTICSNKLFWMQYLEQRRYHGSTIDNTIDELKQLAQYQSYLDVNSLRQLLWKREYDLFAEIVINMDLFDDVVEWYDDDEEFVKLTNTLIYVTAQDSSQDLKDLTLFMFTTRFIEFEEYMDFDEIEADIVGLIRMGANPLRNINGEISYTQKLFDRVQYTDTYISKLETLLDTFMPELDVMSILLKESLYEEIDGRYLYREEIDYDMVMNYISMNFSGEFLIINFMENLSSGLDQNKLRKYLEDGGNMKLLRKVKRRNFYDDESNQLFNEYRDQFVVIEL